MKVLDSLGVLKLLSPLKKDNSTAEWKLPVSEIAPECNQSCKGNHVWVHGGVIFAGSCNKGCAMIAACNALGDFSKFKAVGLLDNTLKKLIETDDFIVHRWKSLENLLLMHYTTVTDRENSTTVVQEIASIIAMAVKH